MTKKAQKKPEAKRQPEPRVCVRCGFYESAHYGLNYADGLQVSGVVLVCPNSTFLPIRNDPAPDRL